MKKVQDYWNIQDRYKAKYGKYPPNVFDFISLHANGVNFTAPYSMIAPLCLCDQCTGNRPAFENEQYKTKHELIKRARELCKHYDLKLVDCTHL